MALRIATVLFGLAIAGCSKQASDPPPTLPSTSGAAVASAAATASDRANAPTSATTSPKKSDPNRANREKTAKSAIEYIMDASVTTNAFRGVIACSELAEPEHTLPEGFRKGIGFITRKSVAPSQKRAVLASTIDEQPASLKRICGKSWEDLSKQIKQVPASERSGEAQRLCNIDASTIPSGADSTKIDYVSLITAAVALDLLEEAGGATPSETTLARHIALVGYDQTQ